MKTSHYICKMESPVGILTITANAESITGLWMEGQKYFAATMEESAIEEPELPVFHKAKEWLLCYFAGKEPDFILPLAPAGSEFRQAVWKTLCEIPYGTVVSYGEIARQLEKHLNKKQSARAVGGAVGHNPISIIIPCHRVIGSNGSLTGYAGGMERKKQLLRLEGSMGNSLE